MTRHFKARTLKDIAHYLVSVLRLILANDKTEPEQL